MTKRKMPALEVMTRGRATRSKPAEDQKSTAQGNRNSARPRRALYHVTAPENVESILRDGLRASEDGAVYAIKNPDLAAEIALNQSFVDPYALIRIAPKGITGELGPDLVAEALAFNSVRIEQAHVEPRFLSLVRVGPVTDFERRYIKALKLAPLERANPGITAALEVAERGMADFIAAPQPCATCGKPGTRVRIFVSGDQHLLEWVCEACNGATGEAAYQLLVTLPTVEVAA